MNDFDNFLPQSTPFSIRVIGFGDETRPITEGLNQLDYEGFMAETASDEVDFSPTEDDKMVIMLITEESARLESISSAYLDAGVLTIGILSRADMHETVRTNSRAIMSADRMYETVRTLIDPILMHGIINYGFCDLSMTLSDTVYFTTITAAGCGENRIAQAIESVKLHITDSQLKSAEHISTFIYFNPESGNPLKMKELTAITDLFGQLPETVNTIFYSINQATGGHSYRQSALSHGFHLG